MVSPQSPIIEFKLSPSYDKGHVLFWRLDPFYVVTGREEVTLEVSGAPDFSDIRTVIPTKLTDFFALDRTNAKQGHGKDTCYRLKIVSDGVTTYSKTLFFAAARYGRREYVIAREIQRKELLRARKFTGAEMYLMKRRVMGTASERRPDIDPVTGERLTNEAPSQATIYGEGYHAPLRLIVSFEETESVREASAAGLGLQTHVTQGLRAVGYPPVDTYDLLADPTTDQRYQVVRQQDYCIPGTDLVIVQLIDARLLAPTSELYKIEIPSLT